MTANTLARLSVELSANTAAFQGDMGKAARIAEKELKNITDAAAAAGKLLGGALLAGGTAFAAMAKQSINAADEMNDMAIKLGLTTEALSAYSYMAKMSGADTAAVAVAVQKLNSNMVDAARGQGAAKDAFAALGISVKDVNGNLKTSDQVMAEVADKFATFPDGATKSALAVDIFGKSGADMIQMLNGGSAGMEAMRAEAAMMGQILSTETAAAAAETNDNLDKLGMTISGNVNRATAEMLPTIKQMTADFLSATQNSAVLETAMNGLAGAFKIVVSGGYLLAGVFDYVGTALGEVAAVAAALATGDFASAKRFFTEGTTAGAGFEAKIGSIKKIWEENEKAATKAGEAGNKALGASPEYAGKGDGKPKGKPKAKQKDLYSDSAIEKSMNEAAAEAAKVQGVFEREKKSAQDSVAAIQQSLMSKRQLIDADYQSQQQHIAQARQFETIGEQQQKELLLGIERQHKEKIAALDLAELEQKKALEQAAIDQKKANAEKMIGFVSGALGAIGTKNAAAAKAGQALSKAVALNQIRVDTPKAAMAAASAVAGIPYVGPALAIAAKVAMYAMGAAQAASVMSGGSTSSSGGGSFSIPTTGSAGAQEVQPASQDAANKPTQTTVVKIESDQIFIGRQLVDLLNEVQGDGKLIHQVRYMTA